MQIAISKFSQYREDKLYHFNISGCGKAGNRTLHLFNIPLFIGRRMIVLGFLL